MDHGHPDARFYPIGMVWEEVEFVVRRVDAVLAKEVVLFQSALSTIPQQGMKSADLKKRMQGFREAVEKLTED